MGLRINQNIAAMNAYRNLSVTDGQMAKSLEKLSSGFRINRAADDAAGLSISEGLRSQVGGLKVAVRNAQDGISLVQTAEGALTEVHALLQRARDLAVQASNKGTTSEAAREAAATEVRQALDEIDRISSATEFGGKKLLDGSETGFLFHVGSGSGAANQVNVQIGAMSASGLGLRGDAATVQGVDLTAGDVTISDGSSMQLSFSTDGGASVTAATVSLNTSGVAKTYDTQNTDAAVATAAKDALVTDLQAAVDDAFGAGKIKVSHDGTNLSFSTVGGGAESQITVVAEDTDDALGFDNGDTDAGSSTGSVADLISAGSTAAIDTLDAAITSVSTQRANLGAYQNRLEHTIANLSVSQENLAAAESRIRDTDMAQEMVSFTRAQILTQAGTAMLAQANQAPQSVLSLLR